MLKWIAGGAAVFFAGRYLSQLSMASKNITTQVAVQIRKVTLSGIELRALVKLQNPNPIQLQLQHPFVQIKYKNSLLGSSDVQNELLNISANSEKVFDLTIRSAGWISLLQILGAEIVENIRKGEGVQFGITAITTSRVNNIPFVKEDLIQISI